MFTMIIHLTKAQLGAAQSTAHAGLWVTSMVCAHLDLAVPQADFAALQPCIEAQHPFGPSETNLAWAWAWADEGQGGRCLLSKEHGRMRGIAFFFATAAS